MKLLFDANLSPSLVGRMSELFPESVHVETLGIEESDTAIWKHARENGLTIVSKDSDFEQRAAVLGSPPKVVWVRLGNCPTGAIDSLLRIQANRIREFITDAEESILVLP